MRRSIATLSCFCVLAGCASRPDSISAQYVSPIQYQSHNCRQIEGEMYRVNSRVREVSGQQSSEATKDAIALGVGLVLFWPALFFMIGDDQEDELGRLKGEYEALENASIQKNCGLMQTAGTKNAPYTSSAAYSSYEHLESATWDRPGSENIGRFVAASESKWYGQDGPWHLYLKSENGILTGRAKLRGVEPYEVSGEISQDKSVKGRIDEDGGSAWGTLGGQFPRVFLVQNGKIRASFYLKQRD